MERTEQWGMIELTFSGKQDGNPFTDYEIHADFTREGEIVRVSGFYDGEGIYKVRFMPVRTGVYHYRVDGTFGAGVSEGSIEVTEPVSRNNHGMVRVLDRHYLEYSDGTPYYSVGTTCYAWVHQNRELQEQTLRTLGSSWFNKIRFCIFPKFYRFNEEEPEMYPYLRGSRAGIDEERLKKSKIMPFHTHTEVKDITDFDCYRFNTEMFRKFDRRIEQLRDMGIEADLILMHPYDKWGFANMTSECDRLYLNYVAARYGAYRNVWWSMANEYDLMTKTEQEWEDLAQTIRQADPYGHMISIHNCMKFYDYRKEWITHCSMQRIDYYKHVELTDRYMEEYDKPVVWDEICYEGNVSQGWGNISGEELVRRFWEAFVRGGYAGHGETYMGNKIWWSHGGVLRGTSEPRIRFLRKIMEQTPGKFLKCVNRAFDEVVGVPYQTTVKPRSFFEPVEYVDYEIHYYGFGRPSEREFELPSDQKYQVEVIDTWNMTVTDMGIHSGYTKVELPGREYMAVRLRRV